MRPIHSVEQNPSSLYPFLGCFLEPMLGRKSVSSIPRVGETVPVKVNELPLRHMNADGNNFIGIGSQNIQAINLCPNDVEAQGR